MKSGIDDIKDSLECMVKDDDDFKLMKTQVKTLWDDRNKLIGWLLGAGIVGGTTGAILQNIVKTITASVK